MNIVAFATPLSPGAAGSSHASPPPATRIGSNGVASRQRFWYGSRCLPLGGVAADAAAAADPGDALIVLVDVVRVVGVAVVAPQVDRLVGDLRGAAGRARSVTQIGRPLPISRSFGVAVGPTCGMIGPSQSWSLRRAGPPVQMYRHFWMQLDVWPDGSSTKSPTCLRFFGSAYEIT